MNNWTQEKQAQNKWAYFKDVSVVHRHYFPSNSIKTGTLIPPWISNYIHYHVRDEKYLSIPKL